MVMRKRKRRVEIDVDGVLANMDGSYEPYLRPFIPDFTEDKYIRQWNMADVGHVSPKALEKIRELWVDPEFLRSLPRFENVVEGLRLLDSIPNLEIVIHTHIKGNADAIAARYEWIKALEKDVGGNFTIDICAGEFKQMRTDTYYIIEDNVRNLNNSPAKVKFLVRRCHNRAFTVDDIVINQAADVVDSFYEAAKTIYDDMMS